MPARKFTGRPQPVDPERGLVVFNPRPDDVDDFEVGGREIDLPAGRYRVYSLTIDEYHALDEGLQGGFRPIGNTFVRIDRKG